MTWVHRRCVRRALTQHQSRVFHPLVGAILVAGFVNNAVGRATSVRIALAFDSDRVILTVSDDGCGFEPGEQDATPTAAEHLGLLTMRERAARIRGQLAVISRPGHGTTIETSAPVTAE